MTIEATSWAFSTPLAQTPLERLVLILLADSTDPAGICCTRLDRVAADACMTMEELREVVSVLHLRGVLASVRPVDAADSDFENFDVLFFAGWPEAAAQVDPVDGRLLQHDLYGWVVIE